MVSKNNTVCLEWTKYATERFGEDTKIVLGGISMGAAIVLLAAGLDLPDTVKGILATVDIPLRKRLYRRCQETADYR